MRCSLYLFIGLEKFVIRGYTPSDAKLVDTIADLRWLLFSKYSYEVLKLPPATSALKYRIFRAHYASLILKKCTPSIQILPDSCGFS